MVTGKDVEHCPGVQPYRPWSFLRNSCLILRNSSASNLHAIEICDDAGV